MKPRVLVFGVALGLCSCMGTGEVQGSPEESAARRPAGPTVTPSSRADQLPEAPRLLLPSGPNPLHHNATFEVSDPAKAAGRAQQLLVESKAEIVGFSSSDGQANVQARAERGQCAPIIASLQTMGMTVRNLSASEDNRNAAIRQHTTRLRRIRIAQRELAKWSRGVSDPETLDGLALLQQLAENDRQGQESQLANYAEQGNDCRIYVDFRRPEAEANPQQGRSMG